MKAHAHVCAIILQYIDNLIFKFVECIFGIIHYYLNSWCKCMYWQKQYSFDYKIVCAVCVFNNISGLVIIETLQNFQGNIK